MIKTILHKPKELTGAEIMAIFEHMPSHIKINGSYLHWSNLEDLDDDGEEFYTSQLSDRRVKPVKPSIKAVTCDPDNNGIACKVQREGEVATYVLCCQSRWDDSPELMSAVKKAIEAHNRQFRGEYPSVEKTDNNSDFYGAF